jgi:VIT1/CCC1 family predicted Fe2+/Mn2+ transporter
MRGWRGCRKLLSRLARIGGKSFNPAGTLLAGARGRVGKEKLEGNLSDENAWLGCGCDCNYGGIDGMKERNVSGLKQESEAIGNNRGLSPVVRGLSPVVPGLSPVVPLLFIPSRWAERRPTATALAAVLRPSR